MKRAILREKESAVEKQRFDSLGYPSIAVIGDCGWSKRSYGSNYTAKSAAGVIIGSNTREILHIGIRNKYCSICDTETRKNQAHDCFKNWHGPSTTMESSIILEGFKKLSTVDGIHITQYIGDSDSSVYSTL